MSQAVNDQAFETLFRGARTFRKFRREPLAPQALMAVYDLMRLGPTAGNSCPARIVFLLTEEAKERLRPHLDPGNVDKTMNAPATAILAYDLAFYEMLPKLNPNRPGARDATKRMDPAALKETAIRSATLQAGYFILAARAVGLDCGPMEGFSSQGVDREFFSGTEVKSNFLCNLGHGDEPELAPRAPRLSFDEACSIL